MADQRNGWVLIVEDEKEFAETLAQRLGREGFRVQTTSKVSEASTKIKNQRFACILLDIKLEQGSGDQVVAIARMNKTGFNYKTPILIMSGALGKDTLSKIAKEIAGVLIKPFEQEALVTKMKQVIKAAEEAAVAEAVAQEKALREAAEKETNKSDF
ncbi:MAG: response regulator [Bdellovibrionota bacterium]